MGDVINLRQARKERDRAAKEREAARNRVLYGRNKVAKEVDASERDQTKRKLDQHRLGELPDEPTPGKPTR